MVLAILNILIIMKFLNSKSLVQRNIQNQLQFDLALVTIMYVILYSSMFITCEIFGPLTSITALNTTLWILQCLFNMGFNCIITLQFIQLFNIFSITILEEWSESMHLLLSRILIFPFGVIIGSGLCSVGAGSCKKTAIYNHFIIDSLRSPEDKFSLMSGITWISYGLIILSCQVSIEVKRFALNKADQKADNLALNATKKIQDAVSKLKTHKPVELKIHNLIPDTQQSVQGVYPSVFQNLKVNITSTTQNKVIPESEFIPSFADCQKNEATQYVQNPEIGIRAPQLLNTVYENFELEEIQVNEVNQALEPIKNLWKGQLENVQINVLGSFQEPTKTKFYAGHKSDKVDPFDTHEIPYLIEQNKKSSRDQVKIYTFEKYYLCVLNVTDETA